MSRHPQRNRLSLYPRIAWQMVASSSAGSSAAYPMVTFISRVALVGMILAVAILVVVLAVMNGFDKEFRGRILGLVPHATVALTEPTSNWKQQRTELLMQAGIEVVQPFVQFPGIVRKGSVIQPAVLQGMRWSDLTAVQREFLQPGDQLDRDEQGVRVLPRDGLVLGAGIARQLRVGVGDRVGVFVVNEGRDWSRSSLRETSQRNLRVVAIVDTGTEVDQGFAMLSLATAASMIDLGASVQGFHLQVDDSFNARVVARRAALGVGLSAHVFDWTRTFGNLYTAIQLSGQLVVLLVMSIIAVAAFNIVVTLGMVVRHKRPDIAILRTQGMRRSGIIMIFLLQGLVITLLGSIVGVMIGVALALCLPQLVEWLQVVLRAQLLDSSIYPVDYLPIQLQLTDIATVLVTAIAMGLLATCIPAWRASRIPPAQGLRDS